MCSCSTQLHSSCGFYRFSLKRNTFDFVLAVTSKEGLIIVVPDSTQQHKKVPDSTLGGRRRGVCYS